MKNLAIAVLLSLAFVGSATQAAEVFLSQGGFDFDFSTDDFDSLPAGSADIPIENANLIGPDGMSYLYNIVPFLYTNANNPALVLLSSPVASNSMSNASIQWDNLAVPLTFRTTFSLDNSSSLISLNATYDITNKGLDDATGSLVLYHDNQVTQFQSRPTSLGSNNTVTTTVPEGYLLTQTFGGSGGLDSPVALQAGEYPDLVSSLLDPSFSGLVDGTGFSQSDLLTFAVQYDFNIAPGQTLSWSSRTQVSAVPEPSTLSFCGLFGVALAVIRKRRMSNNEIVGR